MTTRRISRGTPAMLTTEEQRSYVRQLDNYPGLAEAVETILGRTLSSMTFQEKVTAMHEYLEIGRGAAAFAASTKAIGDMLKQAEALRNELTLADELTLTQARVRQLEEQIANQSSPETKPKR